MHPPRECDHANKVTKAASIEFCTDTKEWAERLFSECDLGDARRTRRLVDYAARQAQNPSASPNEVCHGDDAAAEATYRFLRNNAIKPEAMEEAPFRYNAALCADSSVVLAIQDTTALAYPHSVAEELGDLGGGRGFVVHSTLAIDGETQNVIGLIDQQRWTRDDDRPKGRARRKLPYEERESYKWELASQRTEQRVISMDNIIQVADREADIYEYLERRIEKNHRFVIRAAYDRRLATNKGLLWEYMRARSVRGKYEVLVQQRGAQPAKYDHSIRPAREARVARMEIRTAKNVRLLSPGDSESSISVNVVYVREVDPPGGKDALEWMILTTEAVNTKHQATTVIKYYECRWLIEEFHKAWKSGCAVEDRRLQAPKNLERFAVTTAHVAARLLQLRCLSHQDPERPCDQILDQEEWHCLYATTRPEESVPKQVPPLQWAVRAIAKLGGWRDTKRNGKIGWMSLWKGWFRFQERLVAWKSAKRFHLIE